jgi:hypothetical protein
MIIGMDPHKRSATIEVVDERGRIIEKEAKELYDRFHVAGSVCVSPAGRPLLQLAMLPAVA